MRRRPGGEQVLAGDGGRAERHERITGRTHGVPRRRDLAGHGGQRRLRRGPGVSGGQQPRIRGAYGGVEDVEPLQLPADVRLRRRVHERGAQPVDPRVERVEVAAGRLLRTRGRRLLPAAGGRDGLEVAQCLPGGLRSVRRGRGRGPDPGQRGLPSTGLPGRPRLERGPSGEDVVVGGGRGAERHQRVAGRAERRGGAGDLAPYRLDGPCRVLALGPGPARGLVGTGGGTGERVQRGDRGVGGRSVGRCARQRSPKPGDLRVQPLDLRRHPVLGRHPGRLLGTGRLERLLGGGDVALGGGDGVPGGAGQARRGVGQRGHHLVADRARLPGHQGGAQGGGPVGPGRLVAPLPGVGQPVAGLPDLIGRPRP